MCPIHWLKSKERRSKGFYGEKVETCNMNTVWIGFSVLTQCSKYLHA
jgi:hypothetical protein